MTKTFTPIISGKFCIFCGQGIIQKSLEHVIPQWLIKETGDPDRVVGFGVHPETLKQIIFSWDQFRFPACHKCNQMHSVREEKAKIVMKGLLNTEPRSAEDFLLLFDWFDKVRIGLWLGYRYLFGNAFGIQPKFAIDQRIGIKDRMLAIYHFSSQQKGLNALGAETYLFQYFPSVFSLRINNLLFLNVSWDFFCSNRCGFPSPRKIKNKLVDGTYFLECGNFKSRNKILHPIIKKLYKPTVLLFQPIISEVLREDPEDQSWLEEKSFLRNHLWLGSLTQGCLFRQFASETTPIRDSHEKIEFDEVNSLESTSLKNLNIQTYKLQIRNVEWSQEYVENFSSETEGSNNLGKLLIKANRKIIQSWQNWTPEKQKALCQGR